MAQNNSLTKPETGPIETYHVDTLGAPFRVILKDCAIRSVDKSTGDEKIEYPDPVGLLLAVIRSRVLDPRRLSGDELSFIRKSLGVKAVKVADFLDVTPEHYSRCEAGAKALSPSAEKHLRLFAYCASLFNDAEGLLDSRCQDDEQPKFINEKARKQADRFVKIFFSMKIAAAVRVVGDNEPELEYVFYRRRPKATRDSGTVLDDDGDWEKLKLKAC